MPEPDIAAIRTHRIAEIFVIIECSCGEYCEGSTETAALSDWEAHCDTTPPDEW
jgi:hypothetical protein